ncbi:HMG domain containing protein 4 [Dissostichus eleginoides]|uniref:HMG domain containing protein 4 n=1 Tax=Dissostichus eleginoides TaxID=100907 RepID=A0AAD9B2R4_DISEL|nr:HMG domain containing protein 4 [Dissostichus eleginoides]
MAFEEIKSKGGMDMVMDGERGLVAGRSQREKRRSYKDLLREEEEIAAQVRKSSKKRPKDSELFMLGGDSHKKKKKHSDDYYYRDHDGPPPHKKKHKSADRSPMSSPSSSLPTDTAMGLLQAITSPLATGSDPSPHLHKNPQEPLTLREADGLKMKLIMSPEKEEGETFPFPPPHSSKGGGKKEKDRDRTQHSKTPKKKVQQSRDPLPVVGKEVEVEGHYGGGMGDDSSSSGGELEAGELVIDDSKGFGDSSRSHSHSHPTVTHSAVGPMYAMSAPDKDKPKKKNTTAYQVFCKEYRVNINAEQPGLVFGELSKKLAEVWKAMPEKDKLVWKQKAQYLQHRQNKAEATTIKHKSAPRGRAK